MARLLFDCALRATLIGASTGVILRTMRIKNPATRHTAWTAVVLLMLMLPLWGLSGPHVNLRVLPPAAVRTDLLSRFMPRSGFDAPDSSAGASTAPEVLSHPLQIDWSNVLVGVYLLGAGLLLARLVIGTVQAHVLRRDATPVEGRLTSRRCTTPITVGWFAPTMILPRTWVLWSAAKLDAVATHEGEHARRRDPLEQWLALLNRAIFWFHPIAWWLERRLPTLAEEACDAAVVAAGHAPQDYSEYLLDFARAMTSEGRRLHSVGIGMPGDGLAQRLNQILLGAATERISHTRRVTTATLCVASSAMLSAAVVLPRAVPPIDAKEIARRISADLPPPAQTRTENGDNSVAITLGRSRAYLQSVRPTVPVSSVGRRLEAIQSSGAPSSRLKDLVLPVEVGSLVTLDTEALVAEAVHALDARAVVQLVPLSQSGAALLISLPQQGTQSW